MRNRAWNNEDTLRLKEMVNNGCTLEAMCLGLERSKLSVENKMKELLLGIIPVSQQESTEEVARLETPKVRRTVIEKAAINFLDVKLKDRDYTNVWSSILDFQGALNEKSIEQKAVNIRIKTDKWIGVAFIGDLHIGNMATDYKTMLDHRDLIAQTRDLYVTLNGDYCDNYIPTSHVAGMFEALFPPAVQKNLAKDYIETLKNKVLALVAGCFMKGSQVTMADGTEKAIEEIKKGDYVLSSDGKGHRVSKTYVNYHDGEVLEIYSEGNFEPLRVTWNHPVYVLHREKIVQKGKNELKKTQFTMNNLELVDARDLRKGDYLCNPIPRTERSNPKNKFKKYKYELNIPFLRLVGYWLAEGSYRKYKDIPTQLEFSFGNKDDEYIKETEAICASLNLQIKKSVYTERNVVSIVVKDRELTAMFYELFGEYSHSKFVDPVILSQPASKLCHMLETFGRGDGCLREQNGRWDMTLTTISRRLANAFSYILRKGAIPHSIRQQERKNRNYNDYQINFGEESLECLREILAKDNNDTPNRYPGRGSRIRVFDNMMWHQISKIERKQFKGFVYNLTVPETSEVVVAQRLSQQCHDIWGMKAADFDLTEYLAKHGQAAYLGSGGVVNLQVGNTKYKIMMRHKYRFNNMDNPTATVKKMFEKSGGFDVGVISHNHVACMEESMKEGLDGSLKRLFIRAGTYKVHDRYGKQCGFSEGDIGVPVVLFNPVKRDIRGFQNINEGIEFLTYLNGNQR